MAQRADKQQHLAQQAACPRNLALTRSRSQNGANVGKRYVSESIWVTSSFIDHFVNESTNCSVRSRMESGDGMSFSEFMYPILQSWDWWYMYHTKDVLIQIGGSDQFGNITAGIDAINYINKTHHNPMHRRENPGPLDTPIGFTTPLLTTASGEKFGKSAGNAVWLDQELTSTFDLYQVGCITGLRQGDS